MEINQAQYQAMRAEQAVQGALLMALALNSDGVCDAFIRQLEQAGEKLVANLLASGTTTDESIAAITAAQDRWLLPLRALRALRTAP